MSSVCEFICEFFVSSFVSSVCEFISEFVCEFVCEFISEFVCEAQRGLSSGGGGGGEVQDGRGEVLQQGNVQTDWRRLPDPKLGGRPADEWQAGSFCSSGGEDGGLDSSAEWQEESSKYWLSQS